MKLKIQKEVLLKGIEVIQGIINIKTTLPILSNILLEAQDGKLRLTATDLNIGISCVIPVDAQESGAITIPAKRFGGIIRELPSGNIDITSKKNNTVIIETALCQFKVMGLPAEDFPKMPELKDKEVIVIGQGVLKEMLNLTSFAVSFDERRYMLNGILFEIKDQGITMVATDAKRLAVAERKLNQAAKRALQIIVPTKTIQELARNLKEEGELSLVVGTNQVLFDLGDTAIISRLIEGEFPDFRQATPPASNNKMKIDREQFSLAVKRASLLATQDYQAVKLEVFKDKLVVSKSTPDVGESREEVAIEYNGKELAIGFNPLYLIEVLKNLDQASVEFELSGSETPGVIRTKGYVYVVLPMRLG